jgi:hypothetical protein
VADSGGRDFIQPFIAAVHPEILVGGDEELCFSCAREDRRFVEAIGEKVALGFDGAQAGLEMADGGFVVLPVQSTGDDKKAARGLFDERPGKCAEGFPESGFPAYDCAVVHGGPGEVFALEWFEF